MNLIRRFMRVFFKLLYHPFAFTYDLVAAAVSFGKWNDWVFSIIPFIEGTRILELGHGPVICSASSWRSPLWVTEACSLLR